ncbi:MAG: GlsB/YeaQ/YmgE family stress response membrane protein [Ktedonobacteraceae bacterium]
MIQFHTTNLIAWLVVGAIAGFLASILVRGRGYGCIGNTVVGLIGAVIGGYLTSFLNIQGTFFFWGSVGISFVGACVLVFLLQLFTGGKD